MRFQIRLILLVLLVTLLGACTPVKPWEKGELAKWHMAIDPLPLDTKFTQHVYDSKEGCSGGYGIGGGGCGCN